MGDCAMSNHCVREILLNIVRKFSNKN